ncbi:MAG: hypothetical protein ACKVXR_18705 [Planctomycetota bacterium]
MIRTPRASNRLSLLLPASLFVAIAGVSACGSGSSGSSPSFAVRRTTVSVASSTTVALGGRNLAFLADEATTGAGGTDMNGDTDVIDSIAVAIDMATNLQTDLAVAAQALAWIGDELYLQVDEALDGQNWETVDSGNKIVLLHWSAAAGALTYVDRLAAAGTVKMVAVGTNLFYSSARTTVPAMTSNLQVIQASAPLVPIDIGTQDTVGPLSPRLLGEDESLLALTLDETAEGRDLNGDLDMSDTAILALLDGTGTTNAIRSTELALPSASPIWRAKRTSASSQDWEVGFLVSETDQDAMNLNDPADFAGSWRPSQCTLPQADVDSTDDVLHFLEFAAWDGDPILNPPVNTGLVGCRKIAIANHYVATITPENDAPEAGGEGTCDLNGDADKLDYVVRWAPISTPVLPLTSVANIHALANVPGGSHGLAELDSRFVIIVSELQDDLDLNGDSMKTFDLAGWLSPSGSAGSNTPWDFVHGIANSTFVGASWMQEISTRQRLNVALQEKVEGININSHVPPVAGEDLDILDSVPTFADFSGSQLVFPGVAIAVHLDNAGIVIARGFAFYRVDEDDDDRNWNPAGDADEADFILFRTSLGQGVSASMGVLNAIPGRPAIDVNHDESSPFGAAFLADEQLQGPGGQDLNGDGDAADLVLSYFRL